MFILNKTLANQTVNIRTENTEEDHENNEEEDIDLNLLIQASQAKAIALMTKTISTPATEQNTFKNVLKTALAKIKGQRTSTLLCFLTPYSHIYAEYISFEPRMCVYL